jgi:hypothetical protein
MNGSGQCWGRYVTFANRRYRQRMLGLCVLLFELAGSTANDMGEYLQCIDGETPNIE